MADYNLLGLGMRIDSQDCDEDVDDLGISGSPLDITTQDEVISPLAKLHKYIDSENIFNRQMVARSLLDTLRSVCEDPDEKTMVLNAMVRLSEDMEPSVRAEVMEQIPHIAMLCHEYHHHFSGTVPDYVLPTVVRYLTDTNHQVRKTSQAALLVLLEQELVETGDVEMQVCPVIVQLSNQESADDYRTEAVALMSKMAPLVGRGITERLFLPQFSELCRDPLFHIRKVCAANFGDICGVVGIEATEKILLPRFEELCEDGVWGVRKACAECFMGVSYSVSQETRRSELSPLFVKLLTDQSRWVRMAAFQTLGPFISTFADPLVSGFAITEDGVLSVVNCSVHEQQPTESSETVKSQESSSSSNLDTNARTSSSDESQTETSTSEDSRTENCNGVNSTMIFLNKKFSDGKGSAEESVSSDEGTEKSSESTVKTNNNGMHRGVGHVEFKLDSSNDAGSSKEYDEFLYWRQPLGYIEEDVFEPSDPAEELNPDENIFSYTKTKEELESKLQECEEGFSQKSLNGLENFVSEFTLETTEDSTESEVTEEEGAENSKIHKASVNEVNEITDTVSNIASTRFIGQRLDEKTMTLVNGIDPDDEVKEWSDPDSKIKTFINTPNLSKTQHVIPCELLEQYLNMIEPSKSQTVDTEIAKHCAFSLPGVSLTLGRRNWKCLKEVYDTLASDMQWKVRRTLAFSIHQMAVILGDEITTTDLVPVFNSFLRDLDEVRIGVLKHFADFIKLLKPDLRRQYLMRMNDFLTTDNQRNWRFRQELAEQLIFMCDLYSANDVCEFLFPIALTLAGDRVADVRFLAYKLLGVVLKRLNSADNPALIKSFVDDIVTKYARNGRWFGRQTFAHLCHSLLEQQSLEPHLFLEFFMPSLLTLKEDPIPNVRIALARLLTQEVVASGYFKNAGKDKQQIVEDTLDTLRSDKDRDVRFYASLIQISQDQY
ncbi:serine/threonine-protein phosphatase 4 regulatory subunit 1-like [Anneissia japonica]|uniref:serine/threonine-protein phosphatase 4 regulatory subunit 1-like n=1 Tax=Anneissia japonica TaxID=1529436 RepID=UPI0014259362|nr:serine/threonine-protein phosphatase 4 regulatory subunit 1-like [Anneissia japonica]